MLVTRHSRGAGHYLRQQVQPRQVLSIGVPVTLFALQDKPYPALLLAGGIGITPLLPMELTLARQGHAYRLHYFGRQDTLSAFTPQRTWRELHRRLGCTLTRRRSQASCLGVGCGTSGAALSMYAARRILPRRCAIFAPSMALPMTTCITSCSRRRLWHRRGGVIV